MMTENCPYCESGLHEKSGQVFRYWSCGTIDTMETHGDCIQTEICKYRSHIRELKRRCEKLEAVAKEARNYLKSRVGVGRYSEKYLNLSYALAALNTTADEEEKP